MPILAAGSVGLYFTNPRVEIALPQGKLTGAIPTFDGENFKMEHPKYVGVTNDGGEFVVTALTGYQDIRNANVIKLHAIDGNLAQINSEWAHIVADDGVYNSKAELLNLVGNVKVTSSNGMTAFMKTADVQTKTQIIASKDPVRVVMSTGTTIDSDTMVLNAKDKEVTFEGNVRTHLVRTVEPAKADGPADTVAVSSALRGARDTTDAEEEPGPSARPRP